MAEWHQVTYKRFDSENEDGTGKVKILDNRTIKAAANDTSRNAQNVRQLYRALKQGMN